MNKILNTSITITLMFFVTNLGFSQTARKIANNASKTIDFSSMEMTSTLKIIDNKGRERVRKLATVTKKFRGTAKTMIKFISPAEVKGTTMLVFDNENKDDDMWIYMPALRKARRIVSSEKGKNFMGSEFTNADMSKPNLHDFTYKILKEDNLNGKVCWVIEAKCKDEDIEDNNGFMRKVTWVEKSTFLTHKIETYDIDNELSKVQYIKAYKKQTSGGYFAFLMEKENVQNGRKSVMTVDKFQEGSSITENSFSPNMLGK